MHWDAGEPDPDDGAVARRLLAYDWAAASWRELGRADRGEHTWEADEPGRFISTPAPAVRLRLEADTDPDRGRVSCNFMELSFTGSRDLDDEHGDD